MDLFAELVDAAVGEDGAAQKRVGFLEVEVQAVFPGQHAVVPVAADVRDVAVLLGRDDKGELGPVARIAEPGLRREGDAVGAGGARPLRAAVGLDDGDAGARHRRSVVEARDEQQRVLRAVLHGNPEVGHLHQARPDDRLVVFRPRRARARDRRPLLDGRPHEPGSRRFQHAGKIQAVRLDAIGRHAQPARGRCGRRRQEEVRALELQHGRHEPLRIDRRDPLRHERKVARVERQQRAAPLLPDAMTIAEARERALVPVLHQAGPRVAQRLTVGGCQVCRQYRQERRRRRLRREAGVLERQAARLVLLPGLARPRLRFHKRALAAGGRDVSHLQGRREGRGLDGSAKLDRIVIVRIARAVAMEAVDQERRRDLDRVVLRPPRYRQPGEGGDAPVRFELHPALRRHRRCRLEHHHVGRRLEPLLVPVWRHRQQDRGGRLGRGPGSLHLLGERLVCRRIDRAEARLRRQRDDRRDEVVPLKRRMHVRGDIFRLHRLAESQDDNRRGIESSARTVPIGLHQEGCRRHEAEGVGRRERPTADRGRARIDRHVEFRRERQPFRRRQDQDRRAGPAIGAGDRGRDVKERRLQPRCHAPQRHHRLGEDDAYFVPLLADRDFTRRTGADDAQRRALRGRRLRLSDGRRQKVEGRGQKAEGEKQQSACHGVSCG